MRYLEIYRSLVEALTPIQETWVHVGYWDH